MKTTFTVKHFPEAQPAHRYRYVLAHGRNRTTSEGYPTHAHVTRAVNGMWKGLADSFNAVGIALPVPYSKDSLLPGRRPS